MRSCLIVDDSPVVRRVARRMLEGLSFAVREAEHGQAGLEACAAELPDAILLDWNMPVMNGIDFLRALRQTDGGQAPYVVFCTTENDVRHMQEAIEAGANDYIIKPFDRTLLDEKLSRAVVAVA